MQGGSEVGEEGVESNLPSRQGWTRSYFNFNSGGCNFILRPTLLILEPPFQIIIAQSLMCSMWKCFGQFEEQRKTKAGTCFKAKRNRRMYGFSVFLRLNWNQLQQIFQTNHSNSYQCRIQWASLILQQQQQQQQHFYFTP